MRAVVNVSTGRYVAGQQRLLRVTDFHAVCWQNELPPGCPSHEEKPYAFKAYALKFAADHGFTTLLWADACIVPVKPLGPLFDRIELDGYWISRNGYWNHEWTAASAYADLGITEEENKKIEHVVATCFGLDVTHPIGRTILDEYFRLAQTNAFCGPWTGGVGIQHRHDQTALSVIAHQAGCVLTSPPDVFSYGKLGNIFDERTIVIADGDY